MRYVHDADDRRDDGDPDHDPECARCGRPFWLPRRNYLSILTPTGTVAGLLCGVCWELLQADRNDPTFDDRHRDLFRQYCDGTLPRGPLREQLVRQLAELLQCRDPGLDADDAGLDADDPGSPDDK
jgi:hypothetical protein